MKHSCSLSVCVYVAAACQLRGPVIRLHMYLVIQSGSLNSNLDLIVSGVGLLQALKTPTLSPSLPEVAQRDVDLSSLLGYSMQGCSAVERHFEDLQRYKEIVRMAQSLPHEVSSCNSKEQGSAIYLSYT